MGDATTQRDRSPAARLFVFSSDGQRYAIPLLEVDRVLPMVAVSALSEAPEVVEGVVNVRGEVVPVVDVRRRLGLPARQQGLSARLVLVRTARRVLALAVDSADGVRELDATAVASAEALISGARYVAGIAALPDGLLFIHDLDAYLSLDDERRLDAALAEART